MFDDMDYSSSNTMSIDARMKDLLVLFLAFGFGLSLFD